MMDRDTHAGWVGGKNMSTSRRKVGPGGHVAHAVAAVLCAMAIVLTSGMPARAAAAEASIVVENCPVDGRTVTAYRVADMDSSYSSWSAVAALSGLAGETGIDLSALGEGTTAAELQSVAQTLVGYVSANPNGFGSATATVRDGKAALTKLEPGLYLVTIENVTSGGVSYVFEPHLVAAPGWDGGTFSFDRIVQAKYTKEPAKEFANHVTKVWSGDSGSVRPKSVIVDIYDGSQLYRTVELHEGNGWSFSWDGEGDWSVKERMDGMGPYTSRIASSVKTDGARMDTSITVTNSYVGPPAPGRLAQTGDGTDPLPALGLLVAAGVLVAVGVRVRR